ncbi:hypothetical protein [Burkholderia cenocepacia]|uniref:hypothetical protein n=1 Tax=Burkholderia cenocepacia TaxID=95486 RepID=UPI00223BF711|nr:hypothetical protein [Burkholderia cenocepacia]
MRIVDAAFRREPSVHDPQRRFSGDQLLGGAIHIAQLALRAEQEYRHRHRIERRLRGGHARFELADACVDAQRAADVSAHDFDGAALRVGQPLRFRAALYAQERAGAFAAMNVQARDAAEPERLQEFPVEHAMCALAHRQVLDVLEPAPRRPVGGNRHDRVVQVELGVVAVVARGDPRRIVAGRLFDRRQPRRIVERQQCGHACADRQAQPVQHRFPSLIAQCRGVDVIDPCRWNQPVHLHLATPRRAFSSNVVRASYSIGLIVQIADAGLIEIPRLLPFLV